MKTALIIGGGIGGLSAAISLQMVGWRVRVFEQAPALKEVGAGIQIGPNASRILSDIGVMAWLGEMVYFPPFIEMRIGKTGRSVFQLTLGEAAQRRWGAPYFQVSRADLLQALQARFKALDMGSIQTGKRALKASPQGDVRFSDGTKESGDIVIGADGINSCLRGAISPANPLEFTGFGAWRGVLPVLGSEVLHLPKGGTIWVGHNRHAVTTFIKGGQALNFVGISPMQKSNFADWNGAGEKASALEDFCDFCPSIQAIITAMPRLYRWPLYTASPLARWFSGRLVLLGDSAHPMVPSMAQGAGQAIEDAYVLAQSLEKNANVSDALLDYQNARFQRVARVQRLSLANMRLFHSANKIGRYSLFSAIRVGNKIVPQLFARRLDWLYKKTEGVFAHGG